MTTEDTTESASSLRDKLSAAAHEAAQFAARAAIAENGYDLVSVDDLKGVPAAKVAERAKALQDERQAAADAALRKLLESKGVQDIDALLASTKETATNEVAQQYQQVRQDGAKGSPPDAKKIDISGIEHDGRALMKRYFEANS